MRKLSAVLACRNNGSRLYGKPLQNIDVNNGITIIDNIISCLKNFKCIDSIVLAISDGNNNLPFIDYAKLNNLDFVIGSEKDVLSRLILGAEKTNCTDIFRMTSESPFPYFEIIEKSWDNHLTNNNDATFLDDIIDGCGFEIIRANALKKSYTDGNDEHRSEFCSLFIRQNKEIFQIEKLNPPKELIRKDLRFTVDNPEDLVVCRAIYKKFKKLAPFIPIADAVHFIDKNDELKKLIAPFTEEGYQTMYK